jgi:hypothetical protein
MAESQKEASAMDVDQSSDDKLQQLPWVEKYRPQR